MRYFERGSDDVVSKPFSYPELRGRDPRAAAPQPAAPRPPASRGSARCASTTRARDVRVGDTPIDVSAKEYALLCTSPPTPTRVFTKDELLRDVWGFRAPAARARSTATPAGCGTSSQTSATAGGSRTSGASGYRLVSPDELGDADGSAA